MAVGGRGVLSLEKGGRWGGGVVAMESEERCGEDMMGSVRL